MARLRLPIAIINGYQAATPAFTEVPNSWQPVTAGKVSAGGILAGLLVSDPVLAQVTVLVDVPDADVTNGQLDPVKIKDRYPNHPLVLSGAIK